MCQDGLIKFRSKRFKHILEYVVNIYEILEKDAKRVNLLNSEDDARWVSTCKIGLDTAENEPSKHCYKGLQPYTSILWFLSHSPASPDRISWKDPFSAVPELESESRSVRKQWKIIVNGLRYWRANGPRKTFSVVEWIINSLPFDFAARAFQSSQLNISNKNLKSWTPRTFSWFIKPANSSVGPSLRPSAACANSNFCAILWFLDY